MTNYEKQQHEGTMVIFNDEHLKQALITLKKNDVDIMDLLNPALKLISSE